MKESVIQEWLVAHIERGDLTEFIDGQEELTNAAGLPDSNTHIANFAIDYLIRKRAVAAAHRALHTLHTSGLVADRKNISFTQQETLYPDAVLYDQDTGNFTLVEVKADGKSDREAITELLAYEHELKNHFPFLSNRKIFFVLVSTSFSVLLDHSVSTCIAWDAKQFLCLQLDDSGISWRLRVRIPSSWQAIGQMGLPGEALSTLSLAAKPPPDGDTELFKRVLHVAADMVVREAERAGAHGFLVLWVDSASPESAQSGITIGIINSHQFLPAAVKMNLIARNDQLVRYFGDRIEPRSEAELKAYAHLAGAVLQDYCSFELGPVVPWEHAYRALRDKGRAVSVDFWGCLGEAAREQLLRPPVRHHYAPEIEAYGLSWKDPLVGIPFLIDLCGDGVFRLGEYSCGDAFRFGRLIGELLAICARIESSTGDGTNAFSAPFTWRCLEFTHAYREVRWKVGFAGDDLSPPPIAVMGSIQRAPETADSLRAFASWFENEFLGNENKLQMAFFRLGISQYALFDPYFSAGLDEHTKTLMVQQLCASSLRSLELCTDIAAKFEEFLEAYPFVLETLEKHYSVSAKSDMPKEVLLRQLRAVDPEIHAHMFEGPLFDIVDYIALPASLPFIDFSIADTDWEWLRAQIAQLRSVGVKLPAIGASADGMIGTMGLSDFALKDVTDVESMVLFFDNRRWPPMVFHVHWDDLTSGAAFHFRERMPETPRPSYPWIG